MVSDVWDQIRVMKVLASGDEELEKLSIVDEGQAFYFHDLPTTYLRLRSAASGQSDCATVERSDLPDSVLPPVAVAVAQVR